MLEGSTGGLIVDLGGHVVKFRAQNLFLCVFIKSDFQYSQGLVQLTLGSM